MIRLPLSGIIEMGTINLVTNSTSLRILNRALFEGDRIWVAILIPCVLFQRMLRHMSFFAYWARSPLLTFVLNLWCPS